MHPSNYTVYQLVKYHIELTEAMEYTLITYKYDKLELNERLKFLKNDFKKGFYHEIITNLFKKSKKLTKEIKYFIKKYNEQKIDKMINQIDLHSRIKYNNELYLAYATSNNIIQIFLNEEEIRKDLEDSLVSLIEITNKHFISFCLFNSLNLYISSKTTLLEGDIIHTLKDIDKNSLITMLNTINEDFTSKDLVKQALDLIYGEKEFDEEEAYELLNKVSMECMSDEKQLYTKFEDFTSYLEKEIEKGNK